VAVLRASLLLLALALMASATPGPWAVLWLAVPAVLAATLLLAWRFGAVAAWLPVASALGALLAVVLPSSGLAPWHVLWLPMASLTGLWMGLREEGGGPGAGERAWMLTPLLAVAFACPLLPGFDGALSAFETTARREEAHVLAELAKVEGGKAARPGSMRAMMEESARIPAADRVRMLRFGVPLLLFGWMCMLAVAGRTLASRLAAWLGWPPLSRAVLAHWRLPDAALLPLLAGIALMLFTPERWWPGPVLLLVVSLLGYTLQGVAVAHTVLLARGVPHAFILVLMVCLFAFTLPVFLPTVVLIGLSDVWLDHRRLEPSPRGEA
jgi:hypothetical protein